MKKLLALLLALMMLAAAGAAAAETLEIKPGTPSACPPETFKLYFGYMESQSGYNFVWDDEIGTDGDYKVYSGKSEDGMMTVNIYSLDGGVVYAEGVGSITFDDTPDQDSARKFGEWFGASIGGMSYGFYIGENGAESVDENLSNKYTNDLLSLVSGMTESMSDEAKLMKGVVFNGSILGYPSGLEVHGTAYGAGGSLEMKVIVTSADGQLITK